MNSLDNLWELQETRKQYLFLKKREQRAIGSKEVKALEEKLKASQERNQLVNLKITGLEKDLKKKNMDLQDLESKKGNLQNELYDGKANPKELTNLQIRLEKTEAEIGAAEEEVLRLTEELEKQRESMDTIFQEIQEVETHLGVLKANLEVELQEIRAEMQEVKTVHAEMLKSIDKQCLNLYNRKFKQHSVTTLAKVSGGICSGCNVHLPRYIIADVKKRDALVGCENCGRLLYYAVRVE